MLPDVKLTTNPTRAISIDVDEPSDQKDITEENVWPYWPSGSVYNDEQRFFQTTEPEKTKWWQLGKLIFGSSSRDQSSGESQPSLF